MSGEERQKLCDIARIGVERLGRHAPLGAEKPEPAGDFGLHLGLAANSLMAVKVAGLPSPFLKSPESDSLPS